jgi:hypothetical protein
VRKLIRLIQLEEIAERIMHEGLVPDARDERDPVHLEALPLQVGDHGIDVVDSDCEVVRTGRVGIGFHEMNLLAAGIEPAPRVKIGARQLRHAEHVAIEGEPFCVSATQMATRCTSGRRGRARLGLVDPRAKRRGPRATFPRIRPQAAGAGSLQGFGAAHAAAAL